MTYQRRRITLSFSGAASVEVEDLQVAVRAEQAGQPGMGTMEAVIYGLKQSTMNELSTYGTRVSLVRKNDVVVSAGDDENGMSIVFKGTVIQAWPDMQGAPIVAFHVVAQAGMIEAVKTTKPHSYSGPTNVVTVLSKLASEAGLQFEDHGVKVIIDSPYLWGSARNQIKGIAEHAAIEWIIENGVLAIWPRGQSRGGGGYTVAPPDHHPDLSLVGYPSFTEYGVLVRTEFRHSLRYGTKFTVQSDLQPACGEWNLVRIDYDLSAKTPRGPWFASLSGIREGQGPVVLP